jgi:glycosyltransferase involved in cell wall biosynthesis
MKVAFIVQRYGAEILGGSEYHCRLMAERLSGAHTVEVLTTCAKEYTTWKNVYPEGKDRVRGVTVRRFANTETRDLAAFNAYSDWIFANPHSATDEQNWLRQQGPWCPALIDYLKQEHGSYDALIFFTYLYAPTVLGLQVDPQRSILVPTAHDEPAIRLDLYKQVFSLPAAIAYNTTMERGFLHQRFGIDAKIEEVVGCGVDLPPGMELSAPTEPNPDPADDDPSTALSEEPNSNNRDRAPAIRGAIFRQRHRLFEPFALYGGRIDPGKGCEELIDYFGTYATEQGDATLALMGVKLMPIPDEPYIRFAGMLPEIERLEALEAASVVIIPSPYESLSLLTLESFAVGTPILANARSGVLTNHCQRSNAGLYYENREEFVECLKLLMDNTELRAQMGHNGQDYVRRNYSWSVILDKYEAMVTSVAGHLKTKSQSQVSKGRGRSGKRPQPRTRRRN